MSGRCCGPLTVFVAADAVDPRVLIAVVLVLAAATAVGFAAGLGPEDAPRPAAPTSRTVATQRDWRPAVVLPAILFLYGGVENSVGGWVASYVSRFGGERALALGAIAPAAFYAALALGRLCTTWLVRALPEVTILRTGWTCALLAIGAMLFLHDAAQVILAAFVAGLGCSVVYPITAATIAREVGPFAPRLVGPLLTTGGLGSGVIPWVVGQVSNRTGSLRAALFVAVLGGVALLALTFVRNGWRNGAAPWRSCVKTAANASSRPPADDCGAVLPQRDVRADDVLLGVEGAREAHLLGHALHVAVLRQDVGDDGLEPLAPAHLDDAPQQLRAEAAPLLTRR